MSSAVPRRAVLASGVIGAGALTLGGCGAKSKSSAASAAAGQAVVKLADVPQGGAVAVTFPNGQQGFVARPSGNDVIAYTAKCTHAGCTVQLKGTSLNCPCHGSQYDLAGQVTKGPAQNPLARVNVKVSGDQVVTA